ncbi:MAG: hypothetical protein JNK78_11750 [Planctomycetes bacterium]|nr:hypothetical protein [Planctomycetota bacterium]
MKPLLAACVFAALAFRSLAQATILVGPGGFAQIKDAALVAGPFDTILVAPGTYQEFGLAAGTVRAITPGTVHVQRGFLGSFLGSAGAATHVVGMHFDCVWALHGSVTFDQCSMTGVSPLKAAQVVVHLQGCSIQVTPPTVFSNTALACTTSHVTAIDCVIDATTSSGAAVDLQGGSFQGSNVSLLANGRPALVATQGGVVWLADCTLSTGASPCALQALAGHMERTTLVPNCGALPVGAVLGVSRPSPLLVGMPFVLDFQAQPLETVAVFASSGLARTLVPGIEQAVLLDPTTTWLAFLLTADAQGAAPMTWNVPALPSLVDTDVWFQGLAFASSPMQMSPVAGGRIR